MIPAVFWICVLLIVYAYAIYPLLLWIIARFIPRHRPYEVFEPQVTLMIAAFNEKDSIASKLENSLSLDYPRDCLQILVADDGSEDGTTDIVRSFAGRGVEISLRSKRQGKMANISSAMESARGDIIVMSDANNIYGKNAIRALVMPFQDPGVGATGGSKKIIQGDGALGASEGLYWKYESWIKKQETYLGSTTSATGEALAIRRELFVQPPPGIINDDFYIMMSVIKRGYRMIYVPEVESYERVSLTAADEMERRARIIAGRYQAFSLMRTLMPLDQPIVMWQIFSHKLLRPLIPFFMVGAFLASLASVILPLQGGLLGLSSPYNWLIFIAQIIFYLLAWVGKYFENSGIVGRLLYLPTFFVNSNFSAILGLVRFLTGKQSAQWARAKRREGVNG